ncbi:MAG: DUF4351 domain-containing protein [Deinococcales bacterium]
MGILNSRPIPQELASTVANAMPLWCRVILRFMLSKSRINHDQLFKELLSTFFIEFLELFLPQLASFVNPESLQPVSLDKALQRDSFKGKKFEADLIMQVAFREGFAHKHGTFIIHVEHQARSEADFDWRMFNYFSLLYGRHKMPIYPIALFSHNKKKPEAESHVLDFPNKRILDFRYDVVQLSRLDWRNFVHSENPIASALMAKMAIAKEDRARVKLECLKLMANLKLNPEKMRLISGFVDTYLRLNTQEQALFEEALDKLAVKQKEGVMEITTSWEEKGMQRGVHLGGSQIVKSLLEFKFDHIAQEEIAILESLSLEDLEQLAKALLSFERYGDLQAYLSEQNYQKAQQN